MKPKLLLSIFFSLVYFLCAFATAQPKSDIRVENSGITKDNAKINYSTDCLQLVYWHILSSKKDFGLMLTRPDNALTNPRIQQVGFTLMTYNTDTLLPKNIPEQTIKQGKMTIFLNNKTTLEKSLEPTILNSPNADGTFWLQFTSNNMTESFIRKLLLQKTAVRVQIRVGGKKYDEVLPVPLLKAFKGFRTQCLK